MTWNHSLPASFSNSGIVLDLGLVRVTACAKSGDDFCLTIDGYRGHSYQLQHSDVPTSGTWHNIGSPVAGGDAPIAFAAPGGAVSRRHFYRVGVSP